MTTIPITGKITAIEVTGSPSYETSSMTLVPVSGAVEYPYNAPFIVTPSGEEVTAILYDDSAFYGLGLGGNTFKPSSAFAVGDIIEVYRKPGTANGGGVAVVDENGDGLGSTKIRIRKVQDVSGGPNWLSI